MPLYEFTCDECGAAFEEILAASAKDEVQPCPACGQRSARRQLSTFATHGATASASSPISAGRGGGCGKPGCGPVG